MRSRHLAGQSGGAAAWVARRLCWVLLLGLGGCSAQHFRLFNPAGPIAGAELRFTIIDVVVMLFIILPTAVMIGLFLWRYRRSRGAVYDGIWSRSIPFEIAMWGIPLAIVALLAYFSLQGTFEVNPYGPTALANRSTTVGRPQALTVDVVATDWQWLFVYPKQHIAMVDELVIPTDRDIAFRLTSTSVVNDFYIPQLIGMIDVMPGMRTKDITRVTRPGTYEGFSADLSGAGFSWMRFRTHVVSPAAFQKFVSKVRARHGNLTYARFERLAQPTINLNQKPEYFSAVMPHLFSRIVDAALKGKTYPTPYGLTEHMARDARKRAPYLEQAAGHI